MYYSIGSVLADDKKKAAGIGKDLVYTGWEGKTKIYGIRKC